MSALTDVVVLELATGVAGPYCGRLLRDLGAQVVKVEPPGGDPMRNEPPLVDEESAFFAYLNQGKYGLALPLIDERIEQLAAAADIILHSERGTVADALDRRLSAANPNAVIVSLTPYGRSGPRADWHATELTEYATGGYHYFAGEPGREPLALPGHQAGFHAGSHAAFAALAGLWHARSGGEGQRVEVSQQESLLNDHSWLTTMWTHTGQVQQRTGSVFAKCADGYVFLFTLVPYQNLFVLIDRPDMLADEALFDPLTWQERFGEVLAMFGEWAAEKTKQEIYHAAQELRIAVTPVNTMEDLVNDPQLLARDFFETLQVGGRAITSPGFPYKLMRTPCETETRAPALNEHASTVLSAGFEWANANVRRADGPRIVRDGPLEGLRVIEVTANWAGPQAGRLMADVGADVIKIELQTKPATRALMTTGGEIWPDFYHRAGYFNKVNRNKRAIALDLSKPEGKATFLELVKHADAVVENNAARVMGQLGLAYEALAEANPRIVMCSMSGFGGTGPEKNYSAYGSNIETSSGLASILGYGPGEYYGTGTFYADPVTGNHGAVAVMAAIMEARRSGKGQWIDMALLEAVLPHFAQPLLEYTTSGNVPEPAGNTSRTHSPQGVYRCAGTDYWVAVSVRDWEDFRRLCNVLGREDLLQDDSLRSLDARRARAAEIDDAINAWAATKTHLQAADELQAAGVPAAPVLANWEIASDNHLHDRDFFVKVRHPVAGTYQFPGFAFRFDKTPATIRCHAPMFGEHNQAVFASLLGLSEEQVAALYEAGVTGDEPIYMAGPTL